MTGVARKILICAVADGLILQPLSSKGQRPPQPTKVKFGDSCITSTTRDQVPNTTTSESTFEALGIIDTITTQRISLASVYKHDLILLS